MYKILQVESKNYQSNLWNQIFFILNAKTACDLRLNDYACFLYNWKDIIYFYVIATDKFEK
jgi:hypothetical protein